MRLLTTCFKRFVTVILLLSAVTISKVEAYYTTKGQDIVHRVTGQRVLLQGFGIGCWLLPEGYMWGIRKLDRPWQFEEAIVDLVGEKDAAIFWRLYHENFLTEEDIEAMKLMGVNSVRVALLASALQPRCGQPDNPPYKYCEEGFKYLDNLVDWCGKYKIGVIWDMHGAPGAQNAANISDSDGQARLWTEKEKYWPRCIELWYKIAKRYENRECIVGYDLLNEPLLKRYEGIDVGLLRELYVLLTEKIRTVDKDGIIFVEGDDWAQDFVILEPLDWDEHLVIAFHSYPPIANQKGLHRWDKLRKKYNIPLWHGETGEQRPPYHGNQQSTQFLNSADVGWSWWTHKKFENSTQPWYCPRTEGFQRIIDYWKGKGARPSKEQAKEWLFDQARKTNTRFCEFLPDMVRSLVPLGVDKYFAAMGTVAPAILKQPKDAELELGDSTSLVVRTSGNPVNFQWAKNGKVLPGQNSSRLRIEKPAMIDNNTKYTVTVYNEKGSATSRQVLLEVKPFSGPIISKGSAEVIIDGIVDQQWQGIQSLPIDNVVAGTRTSQVDLSGIFKLLWDEKNLYVLVEVSDDVKQHTGERGHRNDSVEVYIDLDNSKSDFYGDDEFQFRYEWSRPKVFTVIGKGVEGIKGATRDVDNGYIMEMAFPWSGIGGPVSKGQYIGIDVHVNDNDHGTREGKIAWKARRDNSYRTPLVFGTVRLSGTVR